MCLMLAARVPTQTVRVAFVSISGFALIAMACIVVVDLVKHIKVVTAGPDITARLGDSPYRRILGTLL